MKTSRLFTKLTASYLRKCHVMHTEKENMNVFNSRIFFLGAHILYNITKPMLAKSPAFEPTHLHQRSHLSREATHRYTDKRQNDKRQKGQTSERQTSERTNVISDKRQKGQTSEATNVRNDKRQKGQTSERQTSEKRRKKTSEKRRKIII